MMMPLPRCISKTKKNVIICSLLHCSSKNTVTALLEYLDLDCSIRVSRIMLLNNFREAKPLQFFFHRGCSPPCPPFSTTPVLIYHNSCLGILGSGNSWSALSSSCRSSRPFWVCSFTFVFRLLMSLRVTHFPNFFSTNSFTRLVLGFTVGISEIVASSAAVNLLLTG